MDNLQTPGVLSIADIELLHTRVAQSVTYSSTCDDGMVLLVTLRRMRRRRRSIGAARLAVRCPPPWLLPHADRSVLQVPCSTGGTLLVVPTREEATVTVWVGCGVDHSVPSAWSRRIYCIIYAFVVGSVRQYLRS